jgi:hypothetical protein
MKLRYFVVDRDGRLQQTPQAAVLELWEGRQRAEELGGGTGELRLVSAVCDDRLWPRRIYLLRLPLTRGQFTPEDYLTLRIFTDADCVTPREVVQHHGDGWPTDLRRQLAVGLDVPLSALLRRPLLVGGPLFVAAARGVNPRQALRYLR